MRDRTDRILKLACFALGALVLFQIVRILVRSNPLAHVSVPAVPSLSAGTNAPADLKAANSPAMASAKNGTNVQNRESAKPGSNSVASAGPVKTGTNAVTALESPKQNTNAALRAESEKTDTNRPVRPELVMNEPSPTVTLASAGSATNIVTGQKSEKPATNSVALQDAGKGGTNSVPRSVSKRPPGSGPPDMAMMGMPGMGKKLPDLPPATKARVDRITDSEILGPVIRPMPMALLGLAGNMAFLRSPSGQTGLVKEGDSLGEIKLLQIGINRVLIEQDGQKKELTIFSGYGSESLLTKPKESPDETILK